MIKFEKVEKSRRQHLFDHKKTAGIFIPAVFGIFKGVAEKIKENETEKLCFAKTNKRKRQEKVKYCRGKLGKNQVA